MKLSKIVSKLEEKGLHKSAGNVRKVVSESSEVLSQDLEGDIFQMREGVDETIYNLNKARKELLGDLKYAVKEIEKKVKTGEMKKSFLTIAKTAEKQRAILLSDLQKLITNSKKLGKLMKKLDIEE